MNDAIHTRINGLQAKALAVGIAGVLLCLFGAFRDSRQFFASYLFGYLVWLGLALGCLGFLMIHHLTGGRWGFPVRRFYEAAIMTLPMMALLFIPICFGLHDLYLWTDPRAVAADPVLQHRRFYMNPSGFIIRAAIFFVIWCVAAFVMNKWSFDQDATKNVEPTIKLRTLSGPGLFLYPVTATFVLTDWVLSLEPDWYSTMFLVLIVIGQMLTAIAFAILVLAWLHREEPLARVVTPTHFHHLGMLLFAFVMLWTYMAFSQLLVIYSGNLPTEIDWYLHRIAGNWKVVVWFLFLFHFLVPVLPASIPEPQAGLPRAGRRRGAGFLRARGGRVLADRAELRAPRHPVELARLRRAHRAGRALARDVCRAAEQPSPACPK